MSLPYDAVSQFLARFEPRDWPAVLGIETKATVTPIVTDLSTVSSRADVILRINEKQPWLLVIEFQSGPEMSLPPGRRFSLYSQLIEDQFNLPVWVEVVLLRRKANSPKLTGVFRRSLPNAKCYHEFRYGVTHVWKQPVEKYLTGGRGTLLLAVLTDQAAGNLGDVLLRIKRRIRNEISEDEQKRFWTATGVLMGMRYKFDDYNPLLEKIMDVSDSTFIKHYEQVGLKKGMQKGMEKGVEKGVEKGRVMRARELLLQIGTLRFGIPSAAIKRRIQAIDDDNRLGELVNTCVVVSSWSELFPRAK